MKKYLYWSVTLFVCLFVSACQHLNKEDLGMAKCSPNEYMVKTRLPLSMPPDYDLLPVGMENYDYSVNDDDFDEADQNLLAQIKKAGNNKK